MGDVKIILGNLYNSFFGKKTQIFFLDILFVSLVIGLLYYIRGKAQEIFAQLQAAGPTLLELGQHIQENTVQDIGGTAAYLDNLLALEQQFISLHHFSIPLGILVAWLLVEWLVWRKLKNVPFMYFFLFSLPLLGSLFWFVYIATDVLQYIIFGIGESTIVPLILSLCILFIVSYFSFVLLVNWDKDIKKTVNKALRHYKAMAVFTLVSILYFIIMILLAITYIFLVAETSIIIPVILILITVAGSQFAREWFIHLVK